MTVTERDRRRVRVHGPDSETHANCDPIGQKRCRTLSDWVPRQS
jgi:hypothetical protein